MTYFNNNHIIYGTIKLSFLDKVIKMMRCFTVPFLMFVIIINIFLLCNFIRYFYENNIKRLNEAYMTLYIITSICSCFTRICCFKSLKYCTSISRHLKEKNVMCTDIQFSLRVWAISWQKDIHLKANASYVASLY
jgi:hypothetical protein